MTVVRNLRGTCDDRAPGGLPWAAYNRAETHSTRRTCVVSGCSREATVGAHVEPIDPLWPLYGVRAIGEPGIALMCHAHNHHTNTGPMNIDKRAKLAPLPQRPSLDDLLGCIAENGSRSPAPFSSLGDLPPASYEAIVMNDLRATHERDRGLRGSNVVVGGLVAVLTVGLAGLIYLGATRDQAADAA
jgi:hypothetical protein